MDKSSTNAPKTRKFIKYSKPSSSSNSTLREDSDKNVTELKTNKSTSTCDPEDLNESGYVVDPLFDEANVEFTYTKSTHYRKVFEYQMFPDEEDKASKLFDQMMKNSKDDENSKFDPADESGYESFIFDEEIQKIKEK